jgi:EmrB/QacA subfamily drug resistance transporter
LIICRAIQGLGAGALIPLSMTINADIYTLRERAKMQGLFSGVWGLASILGPLAGGFITDHWSWRWIFLINIPFGLAAAVVVGIALVEPVRDQKAVIDFAGAIWLTLAVTLLLLVLVEVGDPRMWSNPLMLLALGLVLIFSLLFVRVEKRAKDPIFPLPLFSNRVVTAGCVIGFLVGAGMFAVLAFIPLFVQGAMRGTAVDAGVLLTPLLLGWVVMAVVGGRLMFRIGFRTTILSGLFVLLSSFAWLSSFQRTTPRAFLIADMALMGGGVGLVMFALMITMQNSVRRDQLGIVTSLNQFSRSIGQTVGVALLGTVLTISLTSRLDEIRNTSGLPRDEVERVVHNISDLVDPVGRATLKPELLTALESALAGALNNVFLVATGVSLLAFLGGFYLPSHAVPEEGKKKAVEQIPTSAAECERLLMAEMTTIDPDHEPVGLEAHKK